MPSAVALLSGGLDSGTGVAMWLAQPDHQVGLCLTFDYGQRSAPAELRAAARLAGRFRVPWRGVELPWLGDAARRAGSALMPGGPEVPSVPGGEGDAATAAAVWVPARNLVLVAAAASYAEGIGAGWVLAGFNREEAATFPDNSAAFLAACDAALALGTRTGVRVCSPTIDLDKPAIVAEARALGLAAEDFWSCYLPGPEPCGACESCARGRRAWAG